MHIDRTALLAYISGTLNVDTRGVDDDTPLFSSGLIDSFSMIDLITHLEGSTGQRIAPADITLDNFDTLGRMIAYLGRAA